MSRQLLTVLALRRRAEDNAVRELASRQSEAAAGRDEALAARIEAGRPVEGDDAGSFTVSHDLSARRQERFQNALAQAAASDAAAVAALVSYSAARAQTQMIERLLEKKAVAAQERALVLEQGQIDDAAAAQWTRFQEARSQEARSQEIRSQEIRSPEISSQQSRGHA